MSDPRGSNSSKTSGKDDHVTDHAPSGPRASAVPAVGTTPPSTTAAATDPAAFSRFLHFTPEQHAAARAAAAAVMAGGGPPLLGGAPTLPSTPQGIFRNLPGSGTYASAGMSSMFSPSQSVFSPATTQQSLSKPCCRLHFVRHRPVHLSLMLPCLTPSTMQPPLPPSGSPPKPTRQNQPDYKKDWVLSACQKEMRRRAEAAGAKGVFRYGNKPDDINRSISNVKKDQAAEQLMAHDAWFTSKGFEPAWKFAPQGTPELRRIAHLAKAAAEAEEEKAKKKSRTSADSARLAFIMFSDEIYERLLLSENPPTDRNKRDLKQIGSSDPDGVWGDVVKFFLDEDLELGGVSPRNPKSHADSTAAGVPKMWETLRELDYEEPVQKWKEEWTFTDGPKKGEVDKDRARERIEGWWKDMRAEYRKAVRRIEASGNHAEHKWSFCDQKYYVMLMLDWYELRGGDNANDYCKQYFDVKLDEDNGEAFNSTTIEQDSSDSDDDLIERSRGKKCKKQGTRAGTHATKLDGEFGKITKAFRAAGNKLAKAMTAMADNNKPDPVEAMLWASDRVDALQDKLQAANEAGADDEKISRLEANLEAAKAAWKTAQRKADEANRGGWEPADPTNEVDSFGDVDGGESDDGLDENV